MIVWKKIPGFTRYSASSSGDIRRDVQMGPIAPGIVPQSSNRKYKKCSITDDSGKYRTPSVHSLVALAFIGTRIAGTQVCHNNGNGSDNRPENLRYDNAKANMADRVGHGTHFSGETTPNATLSKDQVVKIVALLLEKKLRQADIANMFGISQGTVCDISRGKTWKSVSGGRIDCRHKAGYRKLTETQVRMIYEMRSRGRLLSEIAAEFGVCASNICTILKGRSWAEFREQHKRAA